MGRWKDGAQCAVMLTFDVDAETLWLSGDMANMSKTGMLSQGTYGARVAVPLILDLLRERSLAATFFVPGWTAENHSDIIGAIHSMGHELGHHGWIHEWPTNLSREDEEHVLRQGVDALSAITGKPPAGYRSPAWEFSSNTLDLLAQYGFRYSSNLMSHFIPFMHEQHDLIELPVQWILDDAPFFLFGSGRNARPIHSAAAVQDVWMEEFQGIYRYGGLFNLTMHPQVIGRPGRLIMLERMIDHIRSFPDVWIATGEEIAEFWRDHERDMHPGRGNR
jgi:peptidoglycan/xylan/chitin deacetylase (PgdA/CDA1 family)